jgi:hypothetical protein
VIPETKNLPAPGKNKKLVLEVRKSLNKAKFSPVSILVNQVFPVLEPKEQARVCLELISYLFPKPTAAATTKKSKVTKVTINNQQVANHANIKTSTGLSQAQLDQLEKLASE